MVVPVATAYVIVLGVKVALDSFYKGLLSVAQLAKSVTAWTMNSLLS